MSSAQSCPLAPGIVRCLKSMPRGVPLVVGVAQAQTAADVDTQLFASVGDAMRARRAALAPRCVMCSSPDVADDPVWLWASPDDFARTTPGARDKQLALAVCAFHCAWHRTDCHLALRVQFERACARHATQHGLQPWPHAPHTGYRVDLTHTALMAALAGGRILGSQSFEDSIRTHPYTASAARMLQCAGPRCGTMLTTGGCATVAVAWSYPPAAATITTVGAVCFRFNYCAGNIACFDDVVEYIDGALARQFGRPPCAPRTIACTGCGVRGASLALCAGCRTARFCDAACQRANWGAHKSACRRTPWHTLKRCAGCAAVGYSFSRCAGCRGAHFCSAACQRRAWRAHRTTCRAARQSSGLALD